jgi:hypothetical protein
MPNGTKEVNLRNIEWLRRAALPPAITQLRERRKRRLTGRATTNGNGHGRVPDA